MKEKYLLSAGIIEFLTQCFLSFPAILGCVELFRNMIPYKIKFHLICLLERPVQAQSSLGVHFCLPVLLCLVLLRRTAVIKREVLYYPAGCNKWGAE